MNVAVCARIAGFSSSLVLVSVQLSVFSSWRFAHTPKIATVASSVVSTSTTQ